MKVRYIQHMGSDLTVVNAARVSMRKEHTYFDNDADTKLIKYLARENHFTPFTHCMVTLCETVPIFVARQRFKHTVGFSYNEVSRRYVDDDPEYDFPEWRERAENVKQGSGGKIDDGIPDIDEIYGKAIYEADSAYKNLLLAGVAPEQARAVLPQSMLTEYWVTGSLSAWARAYKLRSDSHAQQEIQLLAAWWDKEISKLFPASWAELTR